VYLGLSAFFNKNVAIRISAAHHRPSVWKQFQQGLLLELANPKALIYFSALLPQFIDPTQPIAFQLCLMGLTCFIVDMLAYTLFASFGHHLASQPLKTWFIHLINKTAGLVLITTGIKMALLKSQD
jgi:homoserine/homoserine lactone efflux protein